MSKPKTNGQGILKNRFLGTLRLGLIGLLLAIPLIVKNQSIVEGAPSTHLNFQARLLGSSGAIVPDGNYHVRFKLYNVNSGGSALWTETRTTGNLVSVKSGYLSVYLGSVTAFPDTINWNEEHWLTMDIGGNSGSADWDGEMNPRVKLTAVPYAFQAGQLAKTDGANRGVLAFDTVANNPDIVLPDASGTVCLQGASACGFLTGSGNAFIQGGNDFNTAAILGTTDADALNLITNSATRLSISSVGATTITGGTSGNPVALTVNNSTSTGAILILQDNGSPVFTVADGGNVTSTGTLTVQGAGTSNFTGTVDVAGSIFVGDSASPGLPAAITASETYTGSDDCTFNCYAGSFIPIANGVTSGGVAGLVAGVATSGTFTLPLASGLTILDPAEGTATITQNTGIYIQNQVAGATNYGLYVEGASNGYAIFADSGATRLDGTLEVRTLGATQTSTYLCYNNDEQLAACSTAGDGAAFVQGGNDFGGSVTGELGLTSNNALDIITNNLTRLTVQADGDVAFDTNTLFVDAVNGRVGIGTATPNVTLTVAGSTTINGDLTIGDANGSAGERILGVFNDDFSGSGEGTYFQNLSTNTSTYLQVRPNGTGTTSAIALTGNDVDHHGYLQYVTGTALSLVSTSDTSNAGVPITFSVKAQGGGVNEVMRLTGTGSVGIGTTSSDARLELAGNISQAAWGLNGIQLQATSATYTDTGTAGTRTNTVINSFGRPTLASTNAVTSTNAATVYIENSPLASGNHTITAGGAYALWVDDGTSRFDGVVAVSDGTASAPGLSFSTDLNTGVYRGGTDILGFATAGAERLLINAAGNTTITNGSTGVALTVTNSASTGNILTLNDNATTVFTVADGGAVNLVATQTTMFRVQTGSAADTVFNVDTSANRVKVGNDTGTNASTTLLVVDSATTAPSTIVNGAIFYNSTSNQFQCGENGAWSDCGSTNLQQAYTNDTAGHADIITTDNKNIVFTLADTTTDSDFVVDLLGTGNTFEVRDGGTAVLTVADGGAITATGNVVLGDAASDTVDINGLISVGNNATPGGVAVMNFTHTFGDGAGGGTNCFFGCYGMLVSVTANNPASPAGLNGLYVGAGTGASSFTLGTATAFTAASTALGAGSTITNNYGVLVQQQTAGVNDYGVYIAGADTAALKVVRSETAADVLTVESVVSGNLGSNSGAEDATTFATAWTAFGTTTVARDTDAVDIASGTGSVSAVFGTTDENGVRNNLAANPALNTEYIVSFVAKLSAGTAFTDLAVRYTPNGGTNNIDCGNYSTQTLTASFVKVTCTLTTDATAVSNPDVIIRQPTPPGSGRTVHIDNFSFVPKTSSSSAATLRVGSALGQGLQLLTLDQAATAPWTGNSNTLFGSMYYDTTTGRIQCYEADGWGSCGSSPDTSVSLAPEYAGAVLNGTGIGTMTADLCSGTSKLSINTGLCAASEDFNYYRWTSPQATNQTYSIYVRYQLPATFRSFMDSSTIKLTARTSDTADGSVTYELFQANGTQCGTTTTVTSSNNTWQTVSLGGDETACTFAPYDVVTFRINVTARNNDSVYVSDLGFTLEGQ